MRVLDIDLDFFLAGCCPLADKGRRPELFGHEPWESGRVRRFLEGNCGLSKDRPIPGRIFETHDSALELWRDMLEAKRLTAPFDVTHIDAHSDLGIGYPGPGYVLNGVLPIRYDKRADAEKYRRLNELDEANYLLFALAFRWISSLENVRNPSSLPDIPGKAVPSGHLPFTIAKDENDYPKFLFPGEKTRVIDYGYYHGYTNACRWCGQATQPRSAKLTGR